MHVNSQGDLTWRVSSAIDSRMLNLIQVLGTAERALCQDASLVSIAYVQRSNDFSLSLESSGRNVL
jgi:hypothetical protein